MKKKQSVKDYCSKWKLHTETLPIAQKVFVWATHKHISNNKENCAMFAISDPVKLFDACHSFNTQTSKTSKNIKTENGTASYTFEDIPEGLYCIYVKECRSDPEDCMDYANNTAALTSPPATSFVPSNKRTQEIQNDKIMYAFMGAILSLMIFALLAILHIRRRRRPNGPSQITDNVESETEPRLQKVFLLYSHDFDLHNKAVNAFAEVLEKCFKCEVAFDERELHEIMINDQAWIHQVRYRKKIIIISSEGAYLQQQAWLHNQVALANTSQDLDYFLSIFSQLTLCQRFNYKDVMNIRFSYTDSNFLVKDVVSFRHYEVPKDLDVIARDIHGNIQPRYNIEDEVFRNFVGILGQCKTFLDNNPDYIRTSLQPYDSMRPVTTTDLEKSAQRNPLYFQLSVNSENSQEQSSSDREAEEENHSLESLLK